MSRAAAVYSEQLLPAGHGYPLWYPDYAPGQTEVRIGDVGYIQDGSFCRLFSATLPADHPANDSGVPNGFDPLTYDPANLLHTNDAYLPDGPLNIETTKHKNGSGRTGMSVLEVPVGPQSELSYDCFSNKGALLVLNGGGATQEILRPNTTFPEYMAANYDSWYKLARELGHDVGPDDLIMVNGTVKASDWAISSSFDKGKHGSFGFELQGPIYLVLGFTSTNRDMSVQSRSRPNHGPIPQNATQPMVKDQCVFLSRYRMRHRSQPSSWKTRLATTLSGRRANSGAGERSTSSARLWRRHSSQVNPAQSVKATDCNKSALSGTKKETADSKIWDPVQVLLDYILKFSDCDTAIASDDDIKKLLDAGYQITRESFKKRLYAAKPHIEVTENKLGMLVHTDTADEVNTEGPENVTEQPQRKSSISSMFPTANYIRKTMLAQDNQQLRSAASAVASFVKAGLEIVLRPPSMGYKFESTVDMSHGDAGWEAALQQMSSRVPAGVHVGDVHGMSNGDAVWQAALQQATGARPVGVPVGDVQGVSHGDAGLQQAGSNRFVTALTGDVHAYALPSLGSTGNDSMLGSTSFGVSTS